MKHLLSRSVPTELFRRAIVSRGLAFKTTPLEVTLHRRRRQTDRGRALREELVGADPVAAVVVVAVAVHGVEGAEAVRLVARGALLEEGPQHVDVGPQLRGDHERGILVHEVREVLERAAAWAGKG